MHRDTVSRCARVAREGPRAANPTAGSDRATEAEFGVRAEWTGGSGPPSLCEPYRETIALLMAIAIRFARQFLLSLPSR